MLRRQLPLSESADRWLLISQVEHARLSFDLARAWGREELAPVVDVAEAGAAVRDEWLEAVYHHDDGWGSWEADPPIDPAEGRPYSFLDTPRDESLAIWRDSIHLARREGPLAGWCVAQHFMALLSSSQDAELPLARDWLAEMEQLSGEWLGGWLESHAHQGSEVAQRCLRGLQWFDWLSLWFCLECPGASEDAEVTFQEAATTWANESTVRFLPAATQARGEPRRVVVTPWPFATDELRVGVLGYALPVRRYQAHDELIERRVPYPLSWHLVRES